MRAARIDEAQMQHDIERPKVEDSYPAPAVLARDYVHAKHPDTGADVVFVPGEALPDWATAKPRRRRKAKAE